MIRRVSLSFFAVWLLLAVTAGAQDDAATSLRICGRPYSAAHPLSWESIKTVYPEDLQNRDFEKIGNAILSSLSASPLQKDSELAGVFANKARGALAESSKCCEQFAIMDVRAAGSFKRKPALFAGAIALDDCGTAGERAERLDELRYAALDFEKLGRLRASPFQAQAADVIKRKGEEYDRFLFEGFPMFPWEALANSWLIADRDIMKGPPLDQIVLFHPSAGVEIQTGLRESRLAAALAVEPLGWVHYPKKGKHETWWGVSTLATFRNDMGIGVGASARYENFTAGLVWHDSDNDKRLFNSKPFIFVGIDLYQFAGKKIRRYQEIRDRVTDAVKTAGEPPR